MIGTFLANGILLSSAMLMTFIQGERLIRSLLPARFMQPSAASPAWVSFDGFIDLSINRLGQNVGEFGGRGGTCILEVFASPEKPNGCLRIDYNVTQPSSFAGYCRAMADLELEGLTALAFDIRGEIGGETCSVEMSGGSGAGKVPLTSVMPDGCSKEWRKVRIPLARFGAAGERGRYPGRLSFVIENDTDILWRSSVFVRNIGFER